MRLRVGARTDIGRIRRRNEDAYLVRQPLFAVADGMGGHRAGDVASRMALEALEERGPAGEFDLGALVEAIREANRRLLARGDADRDLRGMGTTLTAALVRGDRAEVAHVGDSRAYLLRDGALQRLTEDHTLVGQMVRQGRLTEEEARFHPQRSILTRALGVEGDLPVDRLTLDVRPGDRLLLCTDGLTGMVPEPRIAEVLAGEPDPQAASDRLVDEANRAGGEDNVTVVVIDVLPDDGEGRTEGRADVGVVGGAPPPTRQGAEEEEADPPGAAQTVLGERWAAAARGRLGARAGWRRRLAWVGATVAVVVLALVGLRLYLDGQWYVGESDGKVAIYNGIPARVLGFQLSHVEETTDLDARRAEDLEPWRDLSDGITATSLGDARSIVSQIRRDLAGTG